MLCYSCATHEFADLQKAVQPSNVCQKSEDVYSTSGSQPLKVTKNPLGLNVNKKQSKDCAASYDASSIIDEQIRVFKHELTAEIM